MLHHRLFIGCACAGYIDLQGLFGQVARPKKLHQT